ncbi:putative eukaryotic translation initiation factor 3 subunit [Hibiscus syriacus]|uniref:Eukaryotic translation initiation factor 3 subunit n=1 Tax=Hibiscus syriacus TaxID=106335 RepID=A0A6A3BJI7_HIBSY|nr:putative eukaryotic translation initiation factor 3 subunit [Hibiscus syriacus]
MGFAEAAKAACSARFTSYSFTVSSQIFPQALPPITMTFPCNATCSPTEPPPPSPNLSSCLSPNTIQGTTKPPTYAPPPKAPPQANFLLHQRYQPSPTYAPPPKVLPKPPTYPPPPKATPKPLSPPPAKPPTYPKPTRSFVAVQGVVYCKSCKYKGSDTLLGAEAIHNATVKLTCKNTKYKQEATARTDKNGYFFLQAPKTVTSFAAHKCTVSLCHRRWLRAANRPISMVD